MKAQVAPIQGRHYKAILNGVECVVEAAGWNTPRKHCTTCQCNPERMMVYIVTSPNTTDIPAGSANIELIEEVKET